MAAHITAASPGGPRYDPSLSPDQRAQPENGVWLCQTCAKLVDNDQQRFPRELLRRWKVDAEYAASNRVGKSSAQGRRDLAASSAACSRFIAAFAEALGALSSGTDNPFSVLASNRKTHDAAIVEFRYQLRPELHGDFDDAVNAFRATRGKAQPSAIGFYELQITGASSGSTSDEVVRTIEHLLQFTRG